MRLAASGTRIVKLGLVMTALILLSGCVADKLFPYASAMKKGHDSYVRGDTQQAEQHYLEALRIAKQRDDLTDTLITLGYLGRTYSAEGKNVEAERIFRERVALVGENNVSWEVRVEANEALTLFLLTKGKCEDARAAFNAYKAASRGIDVEDVYEYENVLSAMSDFRHCQLEGK